MGEKVKNAAGKVKEISGKINKKVKIAIIAVLVLTIGALIFFAVRRANQPYAVLFTGLNQEDMAQVMNYLNENGVTDYTIENNDTILVRESQEVELKSAILQQGYPTSGYSYGTYLDNIGMLSSESDRKQLSTYDLQEQLKAVIRGFDGVRDATVNIALASNNRYILSDTVQTASAAVKVEMQNGQELSDKMAKAIRNYVTHSVQGLAFSDVEIVDSKGNRFGGEDDMTELTETTNLKMSLQEQINSRVRNQVMSVLTPYFGLGNVNVSVHSEVDTSKTYTEILNYLEPQWAAEKANGRGIIGTWVWDSGIVRGEDAANTGGTVGTSTNADLNEYVINEGDLTGNEQEVGTAGEIEYKVGSERTQRENAGGLITDLMVAVAINRSVVEGEIVRDEWVPLVARAAGIGTQLQADKIAIQVYPFYVAPVEEPPAETEPEPTAFDSLMERLDGMLPWWWRYAAIAGGILFVILVIVAILVIRNLKKKRDAKAAALLAAQEAQANANAAIILAAEASAAAEGASAPATEDGADIMGLNTERTMELRKDVRQFAEDNPAIAAQMIRNLLHGADD